MRTVIKGKSDPVWFATEVLGVDLFPKQEELLKSFYQHKYNPQLPQNKKIVIVGGMRGGKTAVASVFMAYELFDTITIDNPSKHFGLLKNQPIFLTAVATSEKLADDGIFTNMCNMIETSEWMQTWGDLKVKGGRIDCESKHVHAQVLGSWVNTAVGRSNKFVVFDELDLFENTAGKRGAWEIWTRLRKSTDTFGLNGHVLAISSPQSPTGIIMSLYKEIQQTQQANSLSYLIPTWELNPNISEQTLRDEYKYDMGTFWRDYACQPEVAGGIQFPEGVRLTHMTNVLTSTTQPLMTSRVMAIDPAVKNDAFGVATAYRSLHGDIVVDGVIKFTKQSGDSYIKPSDVEEFIYRQIPRLNINAFVFDTWMFPNIIEDLQVKFGIIAEKHIVLKEDYDRWRGMQDGSSEYGISVVEDEDLKREANNLLIKSTESGHPKVDHPMNGSKDMADCVANCIWYLTCMEMPQTTPDLVYIGVF